MGLPGLLFALPELSWGNHGQTLLSPNQFVAEVGHYITTPSSSPSHLPSAAYDIEITLPGRPLQLAEMWWPCGHMHCHGVSDPYVGKVKEGQIRRHIKPYFLMS